MTLLLDNLKQYTLSNGLNVILKQTPTKTISGNLRVHFGTVNEEPGEEGLVHFLEHVLMNGGTKKYSSSEVDKMRSKYGKYNAQTHLNKMTFPVGLLSEQLESYLDFISDAVFYPRFEPARIEQERNRVLRELSDNNIAAYNDAEELRRVFYGETSPQSKYILGHEYVVRSATHQNLQDLHSKGFGAKNMDLFLVGNLPENMEDLITAYFGDKPSGTHHAFDFPTLNQFNKQIILHKEALDLLNKNNKQESNAKIIMCTSAPHEKNEDFYAAKILNSILGRVGNSRLFNSISRRQGLAYRIGSYYESDYNASMFYVSAQVGAITLHQAVTSIFDEFALLQQNPVTSEELEEACLLYSYYGAKIYENNATLLSALEEYIDQGLTPEDQIYRLQEVTSQQIQQVAQRYLPTNQKDGLYAMLLRDPLKNN